MNTRWKRPRLLRGMAFARALAGALSGGLLLTACASLPRGAPPMLRDAAPLDGVTLPAGGQWPAAAWWERYQDPTLDRLVGIALADSPTLAAAQARFEGARDSVRITAAAVGAHVDADAQLERQRLSDNGLFSPRFLGFNWYNQADLGLSAGYSFDWWGKQRASIEAAGSEARAAAAERAAAALALAGAVADSYFGWQADQARIAIAQQRIDALAQLGAIAAARQRAELDGADEQLRAAAELAAARGRLAAIEGSAQLRRIALAALCGHSPAELPPLEAKPLPSFEPAVPDRIRIDLLARRPDVAASRWRVEAARSRRQVAAAQYYPDLSVRALLGLESIELGSLLRAGSATPQLGVAVHLPLFDNGLRSAELRQADTGLGAAIAAYNDTVIGAARELASSVAAGAQAAAERAQLLARLQAGTELQRNAAARAQQGLTDLRPVLNAEDALLQQHDALVQLDAAGLAADVALQRALGGGFDQAMAFTRSGDSR